MPNQFKVVIINNAGFTQQYLLFNDPPEQGSLGTVYSNVWAKTPGVHGDGSKGSFLFNDDCFAACGSTQDQSSLDQSGMQIDTSDIKPVTLGAGTQEGTIQQVTLEEGGIGFDPKTTTGAPAGAFMIKGATFDPAQYPYFWYGVAKISDGEPKPVLTFSPHPGHDYDIYPVLKFWVSTGDYTDGTTFKISDFGKVGHIDFTGKEQTIATLTQDSSGEYSEAVYSFPSKDKDNVKGLEKTSKVNVTHAQVGISA